jgi:hypothetical protein
MPEQILVYFVTQKVVDVEPLGALLNETVVTDGVLQLTDQHELKEDDRVKLCLPHVVVDRAGLLA